MGPCSIQVVQMVQPHRPTAMSSFVYVYPLRQTVTLLRVYIIHIHSALREMIEYSKPECVCITNLFYCQSWIRLHTYYNVDCYSVYQSTFADLFSCSLFRICKIWISISGLKFETVESSRRPTNKLLTFQISVSRTKSIFFLWEGKGGKTSSVQLLNNELQSCETH